MSKAKDVVALESTKEPAEGRVEANGLIGPIPRPADDFGSALEVDTDLGMEVDDEYRQSAEELEIQWRRQPDDTWSTYSSVPLQRRSLRLFDSGSM